MILQIMEISKYIRVASERLLPEFMCDDHGWFCSLNEILIEESPANNRLYPQNMKNVSNEKRTVRQGIAVLACFKGITQIPAIGRELLEKVWFPADSADQVRIYLLAEHTAADPDQFGGVSIRRLDKQCFSNHSKDGETRAKADAKRQYSGPCVSSMRTKEMKEVLE